MCDPALSGMDYFLDFQFMKAVTCTYANAAGYLVTGFLVYSAVSLSIYIRTGSVVIPFVLLLTTGGAVMSVVAPPMTTAATIVLLCVGAGSFTYLYHRYSR